MKVRKGTSKKHSHIKGILRNLQNGKNVTNWVLQKYNTYIRTIDLLELKNQQRWNFIYQLCKGIQWSSKQEKGNRKHQATFNSSLIIYILFYGSNSTITRSSGSSHKIIDLIGWPGNRNHGKSISIHKGGTVNLKVFRFNHYTWRRHGRNTIWRENMSNQRVSGYTFNMKGRRSICLRLCNTSSNEWGVQLLWEI